MAYKYDLFISYTWRVPRAQRWVRGVLFEPLCDFLELEAGIPKQRVFLDEREVRPGEHVQPVVHRALLSSKVMLAVLSPQYFQSGWCLTEFHTMRQRATATGARVLHPIAVWDGDLYPHEARALGPQDFNQWGTLDRGMRRKRWTDTTKALAIELGELVRQAPEHDAAWQIDVHDDPPPVHIPRGGF